MTVAVAVAGGVQTDEEVLCAGGASNTRHVHVARCNADGVTDTQTCMVTKSISGVPSMQLEAVTALTAAFIAYST